MIVAADTARLDGVRVIGVDEHRWSHTRRPGRRVRHGHHRFGVARRDLQSFSSRPWDLANKAGIQICATTMAGPAT